MERKGPNRIAVAGLITTTALIAGSFVTNQISYHERREVLENYLNSIATLEAITIERQEALQRYIPTATPSEKGNYLHDEAPIPMFARPLRQTR